MTKKKTTEPAPFDLLQPGASLLPMAVAAHSRQRAREALAEALREVATDMDPGLLRARRIAKKRHPDLGPEIRAETILLAKSVIGMLAEAASAFASTLPTKSQFAEYHDREIAPMLRLLDAPVCARCGDVFKRSRSDKEYCGPGCSAAARGKGRKKKAEAKKEAQSRQIGRLRVLLAAECRACPHCKSGTPCATHLDKVLKVFGPYKNLKIRDHVDEEGDVPDDRTEVPFGHEWMNLGDEWEMSGQYPITRPVRRGR